MLRARNRWSAALSAVLALLGAASAAHASSIQITVTNNQPTGGFTLAPVWFGLHDGTFDAFDAGSAASSAIETVAELGNTGPLSTSFAGMGPQTTLLSGGTIPQFVPGASNSTILNVADPGTTRYLSYAAMVVPSNDTFLGNDNPLAFPIFDASGNFLGPITIQIFGRSLWDAGTEVNNITDGGTFIVGVDANKGTIEGGVVHSFFSDAGAGSYLADILGRQTPIGPITHLYDADDLIATIQINAVPEPSSMALAGLGLGVLAAWRVRRGRRASQTA